MRKLATDEYSALIQGAELKTEDGYGPKVYLLSDGRYLKLFRIKRALSWARIYSYATRFYDNSIKLQAKSIQTVYCHDTFAVPSLKRTAVIYDPLDGPTLRDAAKQSFNSEAFGRYFAELHEQGIYFRSCHLANIIQLNDDAFGLIDISDMRIKSKPLSSRKRIRNFGHLLRYQTDIDTLHLQDNAAFWQGYAAASSLHEAAIARLKQSVTQLCT